MTKPVVNLTDYNPDWTITFEMEKKRIIESLGDKVYELSILEAPL